MAKCAEGMSWGVRRSFVKRARCLRCGGKAVLDMAGWWECWSCRFLWWQAGIGERGEDFEYKLPSVPGWPKSWWVKVPAGVLAVFGEVE